MNINKTCNIDYNTDIAVLKVEQKRLNQHQVTKNRINSDWCDIHAKYFQIYSNKL